MVDLSKARAGDTVKFRCGGTAVIEKIYAIPQRSDVFEAAFEGYMNGRKFKYDQDGKVVYEDWRHPLEITEVIPAPVAFDWSTAR